MTSALAAAPRRSLAPYLLAAPVALTFLLFVAYPLAQSLVLTTQQTYGPKASRFVGADNLRHLLSDPQFWKAMRNTAVFAAGSLFLQLPCALALAMLLNRPGLRGRGLFRLVFFSPSLAGLVFVGVLFALVFEKRTGLLNVALHRAAGFDLDFPWLQEHAMAALIIAAMWMYVGFNMIYFLAALQHVDRSLTEAAMVDGASPFQRFLNVTVPAILPVGSFVVLLSLIGSFQLFELPFVLFNGGGPNDSALTVVTYLYQTGFETGDLGYASAMGWVLALVLIAMAILQQGIARRAS